MYKMVECIRWLFCPPSFQAHLWAPQMMLVATLTTGYLLSGQQRRASPALRCVAARCDADRCYYGRVDEDGNVLKGVAEVRSP